MAVRSSQKKVIGTAGALWAYYQEESIDSADKVLGYYGIARDGVVFGNVGGKAAAHLPGLDLRLGLTREQHADTHNGRWMGQQLVKGGYRPIRKLDDEGKPIREPNPETGKLETVYEMVGVTNKAGEPVLDPLTGKQKMKRAVEPVFVAGHDVTFAMDKSAAEYLVAHPKDTGRFQQLFLEAVNIGMTVGVEKHCKVVAKSVGVPAGRDTKTQGSATEMISADGLLWFVVFGNSARPTPKSIARGYEADPHVHAHVFLSSLAWTDGKWQKVDGAELWKTAEFRASIVSTQFNRLLEEHGFHLAYEKPDRKGRIHSEFEGSNPEARQYFSTNSERAWALQMKFEQEHGRQPTKIEMDQIMQRTKGAKSKAAKAADEMGNVAQAKLWKESLKEAKIELTIKGKSLFGIGRKSLDERLDVLFERLEAPSGVARDIDSVAVFGPEVILPAVYRAAEGLGFDTDQLDFIADHYRDTKLVLVRDANNPAARLYTTETILAAERDIAEGFEHKAATSGPSVPPGVFVAAVRGQRFSLDPEQEKLVEEICSEKRLIHGVGKAGSGKTASLKPAVDALRKAKLADQVVVVSVGRKRATETAESVKADKSFSVEGLRLAAEHGWKATAKTLVILDEAAMANTFDMAAVLELIGPAKLVTIGDDMQASAIGAAGWYAKELQARPPVALTKVYRHKDWRDREAFDLLRDGDAHGALDNLVKRGRVFAADNPGELTKLVRKRWDYYRERGRSVEQIGVIHQGANLNLDTLNRAIQRSRMEAGEISEWETFTVSETSTGRRWTLHGPGAGQKYGDRVIFAKGVYEGLDDPIMNGTIAKVVSMVDGNCRVELEQEDRRTVTIKLDADAHEQPIVPVYVMSTQKKQGGEISINLTIPGNPGIATRNSGYSALTRTVDRVEILLDRETWGEHPVIAVGDAWSQEAEKETASAYMSVLDEEVEDLYEEPDSPNITLDPFPQLRQAREHLDGGGLSL